MKAVIRTHYVAAYRLRGSQYADKTIWLPAKHRSIRLP